MSSAKRAYSVFAIAAVLAIPLLCIGFGAVGLVHARQIDQHGVAARASVLRDVTSLRGDYCESADVSYATASGTLENGSVHTDGCLRVGSTVDVLYDPSAPNVVVLRYAEGGPTATEGGALWTGIVLLVLEGIALLWVVLQNGRRGSSVAEHIVDRRSPVGIVASAALAAGGLFATAYFMLGSGSPDYLGFVLGVLAILPLGYLAVPRLNDVVSDRRARHWIRLVAWAVCAGILLVGTPTLRDVWMKAYGQPQQATITHVEVTHDQGDTDRNYSAQLADGQLLPVGDLSQDEVGRRQVGDRVTVNVDPHGLFDPEAVAGLPVAFDLIAPAGILLLVLLNAGVAKQRRSSRDADTPPANSPVAMPVG